MEVDNMSRKEYTEIKTFKFVGKLKSIPAVEFDGVYYPRWMDEAGNVLCGGSGYTCIVTADNKVIG